MRAVFFANAPLGRTRPKRPSRDASPRPRRVVRVLFRRDHPRIPPSPPRPQHPPRRPWRGLRAAGAGPPNERALPEPRRLPPRASWRCSESKSKSPDRTPARTTSTSPSTPGRWQRTRGWMSSEGARAQSAPAAHARRRTVPPASRRARTGTDRHRLMRSAGAFFEPLFRGKTFAATVHVFSRNPTVRVRLFGHVFWQRVTPRRAGTPRAADARATSRDVGDAHVSTPATAGNTYRGLPLGEQHGCLEISRSFPPRFPDRSPEAEPSMPVRSKEGSPTSRGPFEDRETSSSDIDPGAFSAAMRVAAEPGPARSPSPGTETRYPRPRPDGRRSRGPAPRVRCARLFRRRRPRGGFGSGSGARARVRRGGHGGAGAGRAHRGRKHRANNTRTPAQANLGVSFSRKTPTTSSRPRPPPAMTVRLS